MKPPFIWKTTPPPPSPWPPLKREAPFHEMNLTKSTINNLKSSKKYHQKYVWRSSVLITLQACRFIAGNFTIKWTPSQVFFNIILSPPPCIDLSPCPSKFEEAPQILFSMGAGYQSRMMPRPEIDFVMFVAKDYKVKIS